MLKSSLNVYKTWLPVSESVTCNNAQAKLSAAIREDWCFYNFISGVKQHSDQGQSHREQYRRHSSLQALSLRGGNYQT